MVKIKVHCALLFSPDLINMENNTLHSKAKKSTMWSLICQSECFVSHLAPSKQTGVLLRGGVGRELSLSHNGSELFYCLDVERTPKES